MREPTVEEVEAWAAFIERHPGLLDRPEAPEVARLVAFKARSDARQRRHVLGIARQSLRAALSEGADLTAERVLAARARHIEGDRRPEWSIASTSRSTFFRRRRRYGLVPWPPEYAK